MCGDNIVVFVVIYSDEELIIYLLNGSQLTVDQFDKICNYILGFT